MKMGIKWCHIISHNKFLEEILVQYFAIHTLDIVVKTTLSDKISLERHDCLLIVDAAHMEIGVLEKDEYFATILLTGGEVLPQEGNDFSYIIKKPFHIYRLLAIMDNILVTKDHITINRYYTLLGKHRMLRFATSPDVWQDIPLTHKEVLLLQYLLDADQMVSSEELLTNLWLYNDSTDSHTVETHIYRLRNKTDKLAPIIYTVTGGYVLDRTV
jgi:hypothetical protein